MAPVNSFALSLYGVKWLLLDAAFDLLLRVRVGGRMVLVMLAEGTFQWSYPVSRHIL